MIKNFHDWIVRKQQDYDEGETLTPNKLMELAENMYKKALATDTWRTPSKEKERFLALAAKMEAKMDGLEKSNKALKKKLKGKKRDNNNNSLTTDKQSDKDKDTEKKRNIPKWKLEAPGWKDNNDQEQQNLSLVSRP